MNEIENNFYSCELYKVTNEEGYEEFGTTRTEELFKDNKVKLVGKIIGKLDPSKSVIIELLTEEMFDLGIEISIIGSNYISIGRGTKLFALLKWPLKDQVVLYNELDEYNKEHSDIKTFKTELRNLKGLKQQNKLKEKIFYKKRKNVNRT